MNCAQHDHHEETNVTGSVGFALRYLHAKPISQPPPAFPINKQINKTNKICLITRAVWNELQTRDQIRISLKPRGRPTLNIAVYLLVWCHNQNERLGDKWRS